MRYFHAYANEYLHLSYPSVYKDHAKHLMIYRYYNNYRVADAAGGITAAEWLRAILYRMQRQNCWWYSVGVRYTFCQESLSSAGCKLFYLQKTEEKNETNIKFDSFFFSLAVPTCSCLFSTNTNCFIILVFSHVFLVAVLLFFSSHAAHFYAFKHVFLSFSACNK